MHVNSYNKIIMCYASLEALDLLISDIVRSRPESYLEPKNSLSQACPSYQLIMPIMLYTCSEGKLD